MLVSPYEERGRLIELRGKGCIQFGTYLNGQGRSWGVFFQHCLDAKGIFKRLDIAIDDRAGFLDIPKFVGKCDRGECVTRFRRYEIHKSSEDTSWAEEHLERMRYEMDEELIFEARIWNDSSLLELVGLLLQEEVELDARKGRKGHTLYLGAMHSKAYFCLYEKDYEQLVRHSIPLSKADVKNRFEIRLKRERASLAAKDLIAGGNLMQTAFFIINNYVCFVDKDEAKPYVPCLMNRDWERFIGTHPSRPKLTERLEPFDWLKLVDCLSTQTAPTVRMLIEIDRIQGTHVIEEIIDNAVLTGRPEKLI